MSSSCEWCGATPGSLHQDHCGRKPIKNAQTALEDIAGIGQSILTLTAGRRDVPAIDALARQILSLSHDWLNQHGEIPF